MRISVYLIFIVALVSLVACADHYVEAWMCEVEDIMDEQPDSALHWLNAIDGRCLRGEQQARHALLLTKARYKCYIDETDDSLISIAVDYYSMHSNPDKLIQSLFYQAQIQFYAGKLAQSLSTATRAEHSLGFNDNPEFAARIYDLMAKIYYKTYDVFSSLKYNQLSAMCFKQSGMMVNYLYCMIDEARAECDDIGGTPHSLELLDSIYPLCVATGNRRLVASCISSYMKPLVHLEQYDRIAEKCELLNQYTDVYMWDIWDYKALIMLNIHNKDFESAEFNLQRAKSAVCDAASEGSFLSAWCTYNRALKHYDETLAMMDSLIVYQNNVVRVALRQELNSMHRDYYKNQAQLENKRMMVANQRLIIIGIVALLLVLLVLVLVWYVRMQRRRHIQDLNAQIASVNNLEKDLRVTGAYNKELSAQLHELFGSQFATLNMVCSSYYESERLDKRLRNATYNRLKMELQAMSSDESMVRISSAVNSCLHNIVDELKMCYPDMSVADVNMFVLLWAGLSVNSVSFLMDINVRTIYSKRRRWKDRFQELPQQYRDKFIAHLG